jgi:glycosyltransferase involved in cell wall biosynthesis
MQFHVLSFEGADPYARVGGLATRVDGLTQALADAGAETHLWFVGDPDLPGHETRGRLDLHRWCQWISNYKRAGVYDGEDDKARELAGSLPPYLVRHHIAPHVARGGHVVVMAEEWQTVDAVLHLDWLLRGQGLRERVSILWNANNVFGFDRIDWPKLRAAATITAVSRHMRHRLEAWGIEAVVIPNGLAPESFEQPTRGDVTRLQECFRGRTALAKMARWDPDKRWLGGIQLIAELKRQGWRPLFVARGGSEPHGAEVLAAARSAGLAILDRALDAPGPDALVDALTDSGDVDVVNITTPVDPGARRVLFRGVDAVLANSSFEPFGLVGLETMAVGGIATTGCTGEDYALAGRNSLVLQTDDPREFIALYRRLREDPNEIEAMRKAGRTTAKQFAWSEVVHRNLLPRLELSTIRDVTFSRLLETSATRAQSPQQQPARSRDRQSGAEARLPSGSSPALVAAGDTQRRS